MKYDCVVVGAGPNGLAAAVALASAGCSVIVFEANDTVGGGARTAELTLPGFFHDICSAIHPLAVASPFFDKLPLERHGLEWIQPPLALAHPFDDGSAAILHKSVHRTAESFGKMDAAAYIRLMQPFVEGWEKIASAALGPLRIPRHPAILLRFGWQALRSASGLVMHKFSGDHARAFFAGMAAHSTLPLEKPITAAFGLILGVLGHVFGWPLPRGGSQKIAQALEAHFRSLGGEVVVNHRINSWRELPPAKVYLFDVTPKQLLHIAGDRFPMRYRRQLKKYRYGAGVFKVDWALDAAIPFKSPECRQAGTVHLGGSFAEIAASERMVWSGEHSEKPFVLLAQQSLFDDTRAPHDKHTAWAYCHVPNGSTVDMTARIEKQIERFAPGFKDCILDRHVMTTGALQQSNANYIGGDINGGVQDIFQLFTRPVWRLTPYATPVKEYYICSSSTPPGGGVHGMCGYHAARIALKRVFKKLS